MSTLAIIPARKGSKGLPGKNHKSINDKPLIAWTIEQAIQSAAIDNIVVSTDDPLVVDIAKQYEPCDVINRAPEIADDSTPMADVVIDVIKRYRHKSIEFIILLQPTSPLRTSDDIDRAFSEMRKNNYESCVSLCDVSESPYWMYNVNETGVISPVVRHEEVHNRQSLPTAYKLNGAIYILKPEHFLSSRKFIYDKTYAYKMPRDRSIDIDNLDDFHRCEQYFSHGSERPIGEDDD